MIFGLGNLETAILVIFSVFALYISCHMLPYLHKRITTSASIRRPWSSNSIPLPTPSQPQRPARAVCASHPRRVPRTVVSPLVNNRNRASASGTRQHREHAPRTHSGSPVSRRQPAAANHNSQPRNGPSRATSSQQSSTLNETSNRPPSPTSSFPVSMSVNASIRRPPVPDVSLDDLGSFRVDAKFQDEACPICLEPLREELVSAGDCLHLAHTSCLKRWLARDTLCACPICRVRIRGTSRRSENANAQVISESGWMERMIARQIHLPTIQTEFIPNETTHGL